MPLDAVDRAENDKMVVDRTQNETCCGGSRRTRIILLKTARKMGHVAVDRAENVNILLCLVQKSPDIVGDRTENDKDCVRIAQ